MALNGFMRKKRSLRAKILAEAAFASIIVSIP